VQVVVDVEANVEQAPGNASRVIERLRADGILGEPRTVERAVGNPFDGTARWVCDKTVWPPGPNVFEALDVQVVKVTKQGVRVRVDGALKTVFDFRQQDPNHVEIDVGWELHCADEVRFWCPKCNARLASPWDEDGGNSVVDALAAARAGAAPEFACPACKGRVNLGEIRAEPPAAFGSLAFRFMNWWPLRRSLIDRMAEAGRSRVVLVRV
jgi:hypothetical protein